MAIGQYQEQVIAEMGEERPQQIDPAFRRRDLGHEQERQGDDAGEAHGEAHIEQGVVADLDQNVPAGVHDGGQQHQQRHRK